MEATKSSAVGFYHVGSELNLQHVIFQLEKTFLFIVICFPAAGSAVTFNMKIVWVKGLQVSNNSWDECKLSRLHDLPRCLTFKSKHSFN